MLELSQEIREFLSTEYPNTDIENMSVDELRAFKEEITNKRQELLLLEMAQKTLGNAAYGASASPWFAAFVYQ